MLKYETNTHVHEKNSFIMLLYYFVLINSKMFLVQRCFKPRPLLFCCTGVGS